MSNVTHISKLFEDKVSHISSNLLLRILFRFEHINNVPCLILCLSIYLKIKCNDKDLSHVQCLTHQYGIDAKYLATWAIIVPIYLNSI